MTNNQNILHLAVSTGEALLKNGSEIYRVQDTISHILEAYGIKDYNVYVISNGIFTTINEDSDDALTLVRNVPLGNLHLERITALNELSREISESHLPVKEAYRKLHAAETIPNTKNAYKVLACGMCCGAFCYLFGGSYLDSIIALLLGFALQLFTNAAMGTSNSRFFINIIGSALVTAGSIAFYSAGVPISENHVIIGGIIPLVPGLVFTTSIRDFFNGDHLSGTIHLIDAILTAVCIAVGVGTVIFVFQYLTGGALVS